MIFSMCKSVTNTRTRIVYFESGVSDGDPFSLVFKHSSVCVSIVLKYSLCVYVDVNTLYE